MSRSLSGGYVDIQQAAWNQPERWVRNDGIPPVVFSKTITDYIGKKKRTIKNGFSAQEDGLTPVSPLSIDTIWRQPGRATGSNSARRYRGRNIEASSLLPSVSLNGILDTTYHRYLATKLWAKTNPYRFEVSSFVMMKELLEVATLFKFATGNFVAQVAGNYLNYQFGWKPFLSDLSTLYDLTSEVESRTKEFLSMQRKGGLRRSKVFLDSFRNEYTLNPTYAGSTLTGASFRGPLLSTATCVITGSCRWRFSKDHPPLDKLTAFNLALKKVLDLEAPSPATIWESIPFSWLVDYFVDIQSYLTASDGALELIPFDTCITWVGKGQVTWTPTTRVGTAIADVTPVYNRRLRIERILVPYSPVVFSPLQVGYLSDVRLTNIMALLIVLTKRFTTLR